jgi:hypothetical protein
LLSTRRQAGPRRDPAGAEAAREAQEKTVTEIFHFVPPRKRTTLCGLPKPTTNYGYGRNGRWPDCQTCLVILRFKNGETMADVARYVGWSTAPVEAVIQDYMRREARRSRKSSAG